MTDANTPSIGSAAGVALPVKNERCVGIRPIGRTDRPCQSVLFGYDSLHARVTTSEGRVGPVTFRFLASARID